MAVEGVIQVDYAVFSDTGYEPPSVYRNVEALQEWGGSKVPIVITKWGKGDIKSNTLRSIETGENVPSLPFYVNRDGKQGKLWRQCTQDYKIRPTRRAAKKLMKAEGKRKMTLLLGFAYEEFDRMAPSGVQYISHEYPLIDMKLTTEDCVRELQDRGFSPVKSACIGCPFRSHTSWQRMKATDPESFNEAVDFDAKIRGFGKYPTYVHKSLKALDEAVQDVGDGSKDNFVEACSGPCGT